jgi:hypothetical protein
MKNYRAIAIAFVLGVILSTLITGIFLPSGIAQENANQAQTQMQMVAYPSGLTGFFNSANGMLYIYDGDMNKCVFVRQLVRPGDPLKKILH